MRIKKLIIEGFKGKNIELDLTGRDLISAPNMRGKTTIKEALDFFGTGAISYVGFKREDLIDFAPSGRFDITVVTDTGMRITRWFKHKKGKTEIDIVFDPDGIEDNYTQRKVRLDKEFKHSPLVTFDLSKFVSGDDGYRLEVATTLVPTDATDGVKEDVNKEIVTLGDKLCAAEDSPSRQEAIREVQNELTGFAAELPENKLARIQALAKLVKDRWAKDTRAAVKTQTKAVRALGTLSRGAGVSGVNVEALQVQLKEAQKGMDDLQRAAGSAEERRRLIGELNGRIDTGQLRLREKEAEVTDFEKEALVQTGALSKADGLMDAHEESEVERLKDNSERADALTKIIEELEARFDEELASENDTRIRLNLAVQAVTGARVLIEQRKGTLLALDRIDGSCQLCSTKIDGATKELLMGALRMEIDKMLKEEEELVRSHDRFEADQMSVAERRSVIVNETKGLHAEQAALLKARKPIPFQGDTPERIQKNIDENRLVMRKLEIERDALRDRVFGWLGERGELANEMPEEMEEDAIAGAELERNRIAEQIEDAKRSRQRFEDQEILRVGLDAAEARLKALTEWAQALGLKGLAGQILLKQFHPVMAPAAELVRQVLPDAELAISWETPRGNPGLRLFLHRMPGERLVSYNAMSGAEKAIVGTAVILAFAGLNGAPAIMCLECEVMDDDVEARYLAAIHSVAGDTGLLVMTHHGKRNTGPYAVREL